MIRLIMGENTTMPSVDRADSASETETLDSGLAHNMAMRPMPSAFNEDGLRFPRSARMPTDDMIAALMAESGMPAKTT